MSDHDEFEKQKNKFNKFSLKFPRKFARQINCENSSGDGIKNCNNCQDIFDGEEGENSKWLINFPAKTKDCYDISGCGDIELSYECSCAGIPVNSAQFSHVVFNSENIMYSTFIDGSKNVFGCSGIRKGEYYIFNKKYSKEDYEKLKNKIIKKMKERGEFGEFFPISISPYYYNETVAQEYFSINKEEALKNNYKWHEVEKKQVNSKLLICKDCNENFQIIPQEKEFYKNNNIFTPEKCYKCRQQERMNHRNPRKLWDRNCDKCGIDIKTTYSSEKPEIVYCEECYKKEIY